MDRFLIAFHELVEVWLCRKRHEGSGRRGRHGVETEAKRFFKAREGRVATRCAWTRFHRSPSMIARWGRSSTTQSSFGLAPGIRFTTERRDDVVLGGWNLRALQATP